MRLWAFGDSFTYGDGCVDYQPIRDQGYYYYEKYKKDGDDIWVNHLSKALNYEPKNCGISGASNDKIIDKIIEVYDLISENDIVIIQTTHNQRFDVPFFDGNKEILKTFYAEDLETLNEDTSKLIKKDITKETVLNYGIYFSNNKLFEERQNKRLSFLYKILNKKSKFCHMIKSNPLDFVLKNKIETIHQHTKGKINDLHMSFNGHKHFSDIVYKIINKEKII